MLAKHGIVSRRQHVRDETVLGLLEAVLRGQSRSPAGPTHPDQVERALVSLLELFGGWRTFVLLIVELSALTGKIHRSTDERGERCAAVSARTMLSIAHPANTSTKVFSVPTS